MSAPEWDDGLWDDFVDEVGPLRLPAQFCPVEPTAKQELFLIQDALEVFFAGSAGPGKALSLDTPIATPAGWTTMGDLQAGDLVFAADGTPTEVVEAFDVIPHADAYAVEFDDGSVIEACADHQWVTFDARELVMLTRRTDDWRAHRRLRRPSTAVANPVKPWVSPIVTARNRSAANPSVIAKKPPPTGTVRSTREIAGTVVGPRGRRNHAIRVARALDLPEVDLPMDPYVLGVWLGDGNTLSGVVTTADPEVLEELRVAGWSSRPVPSSKYAHRVEGLTAALRAIGLLGDKHVPIAYLRASASQRLALLQGMMDTDGYADQYGRVEFVSTRKPLADAVYELACSLGQKPTFREGRSRLYGRDIGPKWSVAWTPTIPCFRLPRKLERQKPTMRRTNQFRYIICCERITPRPMRCVRVAHPSHLFLAGRSMIPTHNSVGLLMAACQYVDVPGYHALLLRPSLTEFEQQGGLIEKSHEWFGQAGALWHGGRREWKFPSGASIRFGYLANDADLSHYPGGGVSFLGFDELTLFTERLYLGMFRLLRQAVDTLEGVPIRVRSASNPGGRGHEFVKRRFIDPETRVPGAVFIPATIKDNPHLDYDTYLQTLSHMHPIDRARLIEGDWDVSEEGGKFRREDFQVIDADEVAPSVKAVRYWDLAGTEPSEGNPDPDWTVGLRLDLDRDGNFTIRDVVRGRWEDAQVQTVVRNTASQDGRRVPVFIEQDPGQAGKMEVNHYKRHVLQGFICRAGQTRIAGRPAAKEVRARNVAAAAGNGLVRVVAAPWTRTVLDELALFPNGQHDDIVDALSGAHTALTFRGVAEQRGSRVATATIPSVLEREASRY